ncbi:hypothetical protein H0H92_009768 [Tricholoma furcatifolium]|nr:hypothetical protein H0H92_009768 [Tricholoma furcatifolium]
MSGVRGGKTEALQTFDSLLAIQNLLDDGGKDWYHQMNRMITTAALGVHGPTGYEQDLLDLLEVHALTDHRDFALMHNIQVADEGFQLGTPSASIINTLPFLDWIPGPLPWRKRAKAYRQKERAVYEKLIDDAVTGRRSGMNTLMLKEALRWAATFASVDKPEGDQRRLFVQLVGPGIETTSIALQTFVMACVHYPEWITRAQKEIDAVVGVDRLPSFKDRASLPYIEAVLRARFGMPHLTTLNDIVDYRGEKYCIPKGSIVFAVPWAIEHDPSRFEEHDRFMPERFLDADGNLKPNYETNAFGFGRRICPGIPFAERSLWIAIAMMLWTFNIHGITEPDPRTGLPFFYDDSDKAFSGDVSAKICSLNVDTQLVFPQLTTWPYAFPVIFEPRSAEREEIA